MGVRRHAAGRLWAASLLVLSACAPVQQTTVPALAVPPFRGAAVAPANAPTILTDLLALDDAMRQFVAEQLAPIESPMERMRRLSDLLFQSLEPRLEYQGDLTLTARELFHQRVGNCLSFAALVVALARAADLDAVFQDVPVVPSWHRAGTAFVVERHVNALIRVDSRRFVFDFRPPEAPMYSGARVIPDYNAAAQYLGNLGVEHFAADDYAGAYREFERGLAVDPTAALLWVNLGVTFVRNSQYDEADRAYRQALALEPDNLSALNNLSLLEEQRGHTFTARRIARRVERHRSANPYYLYWKGEQDLRAGDPSLALKEFKEALRREPTEADFHFALARTYLALGDPVAARTSLEAALALAATDGIKQRYLEALPELATDAALDSTPR
jgi:Flp pilus assembly protein TadD